jgi:hypothetical protein
MPFADAPGADAPDAGVAGADAAEEDGADADRPAAMVPGVVVPEAAVVGADTAGAAEPGADALGAVPPEGEALDAAVPGAIDGNRAVLPARPLGAPGGCVVAFGVAAGAAGTGGSAGITCVSWGTAMAAIGCVTAGMFVRDTVDAAALAGSPAAGVADRADGAGAASAAKNFAIGSFESG